MFPVFSSSMITVIKLVHKMPQYNSFHDSFFLQMIAVLCQNPGGGMTIYVREMFGHAWSPFHFVIFITKIVILNPCRRRY